MPKAVSLFPPGALALCAAATLFAAEPQQPALHPQQPAPEAAASTAPANPAAQARRISVADARQALAKGEAVLVDVRDRASYAVQHAKGALSLPFQDLSARAGELPKDKLIITYCT